MRLKLHRDRAMRPALEHGLRTLSRGALRPLWKSSLWLLCYADLRRALSGLEAAPRREKHVAVIRTDNIGDFILWLDCARAIRKYYPRGEWRITLLASHVWAKFAEVSGVFDEVIPIERSRYLLSARYRRALYGRIAARRFAVAIAAAYSRNPAVDDLLVRATGAPECLAHETDDTHADLISRRITDRWYARRVAGGAALRHELERNTILARQFDAEAVLRMPYLEPSMIAYADWLPAGDCFAVAPGASSHIREWPVERLAEVMRRIQERTGWTALICGSAQDRALGDVLAGQVGRDRAVNVCGMSSLPELAGAVSRSRLLITNETGTAHLGAALAVPTIVILGGGDFERFAPYPAALSSAESGLHMAYHAMPCFGCNWQCRIPHRRGDPAPCILAVRTEDVLSLLEPILA